MTCFHFPGGPYFPNQGNDDWIEEYPEEDPEEMLDEDPEEDSEELDEDFSAESDVVNTSYVVCDTTPRLGFQGPTPQRAEDFKR